MRELLEPRASPPLRAAPERARPAAPRPLRPPAAPRLQPQLRVRPAGDRYEQEADLVAARVLTDAPLPAISALRVDQAGAQACGCAACPACDLEEELQPAARTGAAHAPEDLESRLSATRGGGAPLPGAARERMERRFGVGFGDVRVHADGPAAALNDVVQSEAFTVGSDLYFAAGRFRPGTEDGERLLAHELTHVVQQSAGGSAVQRAAMERKPYTGNYIHKEVEQRLRAVNANLVTEAPIPGATTNKTYEFNALGRADLYTADPPGIVPGVSGEHVGKETGMPEETRTRVYANTPHSKDTKGEAGYEPSVVKRTQVVSGEYPASFAVADLKPLGESKVGEGLAQISNYLHGLPTFVEQAITDKKVTRTIRGDVLTSYSIPPALDYRRFNAESGTLGPHHLLTGPVGRRRRIWVRSYAKWGLLVYFDLPHPYEAAKHAGERERVFEKLRDLLRALIRAGTSPKVNPTLVLTPKRRAGAGRIAARAPPRRAPTQLQRKPLGADWDADRAAWEAQHGEWDVIAKPFLKSAGTKELRRKVEIDKQLGEPAELGVGGVPLGRQLEKIERWSGVSGKLFGALRFRFGKTFDAVAAAFERMRARFTGVHGKMKAAPSSAGWGWIATLTTALLRALKTTFAKILADLFGRFSRCMTGVMAAVIDEVLGDADDRVREQLEKLHTRCEELRAKLDERIETVAKTLEEVIDIVRDVQRWIKLARSLERTIRAGVQIISCLSPPALGCLWGLVVQVGLEAALSIVMGTDWFNETVVEPTVSELVLPYAAEPYNQLVQSLLGVAGLQTYASRVPDCKIKAPEIRPLLQQALDEQLSTVPLEQRKAEWDAKYRAQMLADLGVAMERGDGRRPTEADLNAVLGELAQAGLLPKDAAGVARVKRLLEQARNSSTGRINLDSLKLLFRRAGGDLPETAGELRGTIGSTTILRRSTAPPRTPISIDFGPQTMPAPAPVGSDPVILPGVKVEFKF